MNRSKKLGILLGVLAVVCIAAFAALRAESRKEQIKTSGETVLEIDPEDVQALSWEYEGRTLAFHKDGNWLCDKDEAFPVNEEKIQELLEQFRAFSAAFVIEDVEDFGQYGLTVPVCTIHVTTAEKSYDILLGDYSKMDEQRYVSIGDGNVYLAVNDPLDAFQLSLSDMIDNDETISVNQASQIQFAGAEGYSIVYDEENGGSYSAEDVYFAQLDGEALPLDTSRVKAYLACIRSLDLTDYMTYSATDTDLQLYGLDNPELTVTVRYEAEDESGESIAESFTLAVSRDPEERAAAESAEADGEEAGSEEITAYARVGDSPIIYQISGDDYQSLMAASYNDLRHQELFYGDFADVTQVEIALDGTQYALSSEEKSGERTYFYQEAEIDASDLQSAVEALRADSFTDERPSQKEEIRLTLHLDNENVPEIQIALYRYDGSKCLAVIDGEPVALVERSAVVDLVEAVNAIVLN